MTFLSPWRLLFVAAPIALVVLYVLAQRARAKVAARFTSVDLLASVAPRRPGWQRHVAAGLLLTAILALVVGVAQPARVKRTPRQRATVVLAIDTSGSMVADDVSPSRLAAAKAAARSFTNDLPKGVQLGLVSFSQSAQVLVSPTTDRSIVLGAIDALQARGGTATADAIDVALQAIASAPKAANGKRVPAAIVLMSDGTPTMSSTGGPPAQAVADAADRAKEAGVSISTIAFGTADGIVNVQGETIAVPSDPAAMAAIAKASGGETFTARTADQLRSVYQRIGRAVGFDVHRREITAWFTALALLLAVAAAAAALRWTQRLV